MGFNIFIIDTAVMNTQVVSYISDDYTVYNYEEILCAFDCIEYKDKTFSFYQANTQMPDIDTITTILAKIRAINPCLVFNVGANNYVSDFCRRFSLTACMPCSTSIPVSMSEILILGRKIRESDRIVLSSLRDYQSVIESDYNYILPEESTLTQYTRESLGLPPKGWIICCAGNRMDYELDQEFLHMIDSILGEIDNAYYMIIGNIFDSQKLLSNLTNKDKFILPGQKQDASQILRLCDLCVAPTRKGGGRASFEALFYGVPVVVTTYGDSWDTCGTDFEVNDYSEMSKVIKRYYYDADFYNTMKKKALARGQELEDMPSTFNKLFKDLNLV